MYLVLFDVGIFCMICSFWCGHRFHEISKTKNEIVEICEIVEIVETVEIVEIVEIVKIV